MVKDGPSEAGYLFETVVSESSVVTPTFKGNFKKRTVIILMIDFNLFLFPYVYVYKH